MSREREYDRGWREATEVWADMRLRSLNVQDGKETLSIEVAREVMEAIAEPMTVMLDKDNATNYVECEVRRPSTGKEYTLTLQRREGFTPHQMRQKAEARIRELVKAVETFGDRAAIQVVRQIMETESA